MSPTTRLMLAVLIVLAIVFFATGTTGASAEPQIVRVDVNDYHIGISQFTVLPGKQVTLIVDNRGEMAHQLQIRPYAAASAENTILGPVVGTFTTQEFHVTLTPGIYRVECVQASHVEKGMVNAIAAQDSPPARKPVDTSVAISLLTLSLGCAFIIFDSMGIHLTRLTNRNR